MKQTHTTQEAEGRELAKRMRDFVQSRGGPRSELIQRSSGCYDYGSVRTVKSGG